MSAVTQKQVNPLQRIKDLITDNQFASCQAEVKHIYQLIKPRLTEEKKADILVGIYNYINETQICEYSITEFWKYMNN